MLFTEGDDNVEDICMKDFKHRGESGEKFDFPDVHN